MWVLALWGGLRTNLHHIGAPTVVAEGVLNRSNDFSGSITFRRGVHLGLPLLKHVSSQRLTKTIFCAVSESGKGGGGRFLFRAHSATYEMHDTIGVHLHLPSEAPHLAASTPHPRNTFRVSLNVQPDEQSLIYLHRESYRKNISGIPTVYRLGARSVRNGVGRKVIPLPPVYRCIPPKYAPKLITYSLVMSEWPN